MFAGYLAARAPHGRPRPGADPVAYLLRIASNVAEDRRIANGRLLDFVEVEELLYFAPIPEVPPGDVDLIAPLGTIDAGEAGIRVSGNVNLAALQVVNAANIQVKGEATGLPVVASVNVGALTNASAAASQAAMAAQDVLQRERASQRQALPSVFTVRVLGFGNEAAPGADAPGPRTGDTRSGYDANSPVQVLGRGQLADAQKAKLTAQERKLLGE